MNWESLIKLAPVVGPSIGVIVVVGIFVWYVMRRDSDCTSCRNAQMTLLTNHIAHETEARLKETQAIEAMTEAVKMLRPRS
jgi:hypothetical protein